MPGEKYSSSTAFNNIITAGTIAGTLDILAAFADYYIETGKGPQDVLRFIASGVFGKSAFTGTTVMIWSGLLFHFLIALIFTTIYFIIYPRVKWLHIHLVLTALLLAIITWLAMNIIVVPLSSTPSIPFKFISAVKAVGILIFTIGFPLAIIFRNFYRSQNELQQHLYNFYAR